MLGLSGAAIALRFVIDPAAAASLRTYGIALAGTTIAAFLVSVGPNHWFVGVCDELAINSAAAVVTAALGATLITFVGFSSVWRRGLALAGVGVVSVAVGLSFEPACIGGPFAMTDPVVRTLWLNRISEMQSLASMLRLMPISAVAEAAFPAIALAATLALARDRRRDFAYLTAAAAFLLALAIMLDVNKYYAYALWLGAPLVAVAALAVVDRLGRHSLVARFAAVMLVTPMTVTVGAMSIATAAGAAEGIDINSPDRQACVSRPSFAALGKLPVGLIIPDQLEWASYLLAFTPHAVMAGPYHRMAASILTAHRVFALPPDESRAVAAGTAADYLVTCGAQGPLGLSEAETAASLWGHLKAGDVPDWLDRLAGVEPFAVYRVKR